jgi:hemerythrin
MSLTTWNSSRSVKVGTLDDRHKNVFEMINSLAEAIVKVKALPTFNQR